MKMKAQYTLFPSYGSHSPGWAALPCLDLLGKNAPCPRVYIGGGMPREAPTLWR